MNNRLTQGEKEASLCQAQGKLSPRLFDGTRRIFMAMTTTQGISSPVPVRFFPESPIDLNPRPSQVWWSYAGFRVILGWEEGEETGQAPRVVSVIEDPSGEVLRFCGLVPVLDSYEDAERLIDAYLAHQVRNAVGFEVLLVPDYELPQVNGPGEWYDFEYFEERQFAGYCIRSNGVFFALVKNGLSGAGQAKRTAVCYPPGMVVLFYSSADARRFLDWQSWHGEL
jgi:hypothetical protein